MSTECFPNSGDEQSNAMGNVFSNDETDVCHAVLCVALRSYQSTKWQFLYIDDEDKVSMVLNTQEDTVL